MECKKVTPRPLSLTLKPMRTPQTNGKIIDSAKIPSITRVQSYMGHEHAIPSFVTSQEAVEYIDVKMRKKHCLLHSLSY